MDHCDEGGFSSHSSILLPMFFVGMVLVVSGCPRNRQFGNECFDNIFFCQ